MKIKKVAFIGLGVMGYPMAGYLQKNELDVTVFNRTTSKAEKWKSEYRGNFEKTLNNTVKNCDAVFICVGRDEDLREVMEGPRGILVNSKDGAILIDLTTASADIAREYSSKCIKLNVSGAFHSPLMKFARETLTIHINSLSFNNPKIPVFQNINAKPTKDSKRIKENLILQLENPVQWCSTINNMIKYLKSNKFIECGPNTILAGINRRISKDIETINTDTINEINDIWIKN